MDSPNKKELQSIIDATAFEALIGHYENQWFDCKSQPYSLTEPRGKRELAKDVSSFANTQGGFIFIGLKTISDQKHLGDRVDSIRPIEAHRIDREQLLSICHDWIFPIIDGLDVLWIALDGEEQKGIAVIVIPEQSTGTKPFLIKNVLDGDKQIEIMFGYAERRGESSLSLDLIKIQSLMTHGLNFQQSIERRFDVLELLLKRQVGLGTQPFKQGGDGDEAIRKSQEVLGTAISEAGLADERVFGIAASPIPPATLPNFGTAESLELVRNTSELRSGGWNLRTFVQPQIVRGELIRGVDANYKSLEIHRNGTAVFVVVANGKYLAWERERENNHNINPIALIESVLNFANLITNLSSKISPTPEGYMVTVEFLNLHKDGIDTILKPYKVDYWAHGSELRKAPDDRVIKSFQVDASEAPRLAFEIIREIYFWFGHTEDAIPYTTEHDGKRVLDTAQIVAL
jgi:hypothetical protein